MEYTRSVTGLFPSSLTEALAWVATIAETLCGLLLIIGFKICVTAVLSGFLHLSCAIGMVTCLGVKTSLDYSVFSAAGAVFVLALRKPERFIL